MKGNEPSHIQELQELLQTSELPSLGPEPRGSRMALPELKQKFDAIAKNIKLSRDREKLVRSLVLLWHDHLDESHTLSQDIHNADGSFLHAIMHRREPDYGNAKYWFHRVGEHSSFPEIVNRTSYFLKETGEEHLATRLMPKGNWDPFAFVDLCEKGTTSSDQKRMQLLQRIQEIEFKVLLEQFAS